MIVAGREEAAGHGIREGWFLLPGILRADRLSSRTVREGAEGGLARSCSSRPSPAVIALMARCAIVQLMIRERLVRGYGQRDPPHP